MIRTLFVAAVLVFASTSVRATGLQYLGAGDTVGELVAQLREARAVQAAQRRGVRSDVVSVNAAKEAFIIPVAGNLQGAAGTFFKSDVSIANRRNQTQIVSIAFVHRGENNQNERAANFAITANYTAIESDFIGRVLGKSGLGTLYVVAKISSVENAGVDVDAQIDGYSRIWTPQPVLPGQSSSVGTVSQSFEAVAIEDNLAGSHGYGLRQDNQFRTNVGLVNLYDTANTFTITVIGLNGRTTFTQTVLPYSMEQVAIPAGNWGDLKLYVESAATNFNWWSAYGTTVDNRTGDGWVSHIH